MSGLVLLFAAAYAVLVLALFSIVRRERRRGQSSTTHPFLIGLYRGLVLIVVLFALYAVIGALAGALGLAPSSQAVPVISLASWQSARKCHAVLRVWIDLGAMSSRL
jgi:hypothetical protein